MDTMLSSRAPSLFDDRRGGAVLLRWVHTLGPGARHEDTARRPAGLDLERSVAFYAKLGYLVLGTVPETEFGTLAMLKLPDDEFVSLELVHDPDFTRVRRPEAQPRGGAGGGR